MAIKKITKEQLNSYLSHSVSCDITEFLKPYSFTITNGHNGWNSLYPDWESNDPEIVNGNILARWVDLMRGIIDINPKMICSAMGAWQCRHWDSYVNRARINSLIYKIIKPSIVLQAMCFEIIDQSTLNGVGFIPSWVFSAFNLPYVQRRFDVHSMRWDDAYSNTDHHWYENFYTEPFILKAFVPNIRKLETQMWFYYLGRTYIDMGCESLNFCRVEMMNGEPGGQGGPYYPDYDTNPYWWNIVFNKLRAYADTKPTNSVIPTENIRFLLITGWTNGMVDGNDNLAFDFHSGPIRPKQNGLDLNINGGGCSIVAIDSGLCKNVFNLSKGGRTPSGWWCAHAPAHIGLDNTTEEYDIWAGTQSSNCMTPYHWDELSWYAMQKKSYRDNWLVYAYNKTKCLNKDASFFFSILGNTVIAQNYHRRYIAINPTSLFPPVNTINNIPNGIPNRQTVQQFASWGQQSIIKQIFAGWYPSPYGWVMHNFTNEEVLNAPSFPNVLSDVIFVGTDKAYYIGTDYRIHGYIKDNGTIGVWRTVSPSHAATNSQLTNNPTPIGAQAYAKSCLVAKPDGSQLMYIGYDGRLHGFFINNVWSYTYFDFYPQVLSQNNITAYSDLIWPENNRIYYIARQANSGQYRIYGFVWDGTWFGVYPAYAASVYYGQTIINQPQSLGALAFRNNRLFYRSGNGFLYMYNVTGLWHYWFNDMAGANLKLIQQNIRVVGDIALHNNRIYYVAAEGMTLQKRIHCLIETGNGTFDTVSPSWSAQFYGNGYPIPVIQQMQPGKELSVSPDGKRIAYIGIDNKVYYYIDPQGSGWNFAYVPMPNQIAAVTAPAIKNSLRFQDNETLFCAAPFVIGGPIKSMGRICYFKFERAYCKHPSINLIE
ncbi:MAG: hypothetical protein JNL72_08475 [Flavipsychrobacter sp.]|nr:hypothetical protein [Flavipsychrobacter sp.]